MWRRNVCVILVPTLGKRMRAPRAEDRVGEETLLTVTQGGVHRGAPTLRAAPPPPLRTALSGAVVLNAPIAEATAYSAAHRLEPRHRYPGMKDP